MILPGPWEFALGALAAWRIWKLLADDDVLNRPRDWIEDRSRFFEKLLACPYCSGFWVALFASTIWYEAEGIPWSWETGVSWLATTFALSAAIVLIETSHDHLVLKKKTP